MLEIIALLIICFLLLSLGALILLLYITITDLIKEIKKDKKQNKTDVRITQGGNRK